MNKRKNKRGIINRYLDKYFNYPEKNNQFNIYLFLSILALSFVGLLVLFSASSYLTIKYDTSTYHFVLRQAMFLTVGIVVMIISSKLSYKFYKDHAKILYIIGIILLIMVYIPGIGNFEKGARRSVNLGITFMPSDIAKFTSVVFLAKYLIDNRKTMYKFMEGFFYPVLIIIFPFLLIAMQTDLSTSIVVFVSLSLVYLIGGFNSKFMPILISGGVLLLILIIFGLKDYQIARITGFLNPEADYQNQTWQVLNGLFAVSRGGIIGQGYGKSIYKYGYLSDEVSNDMIFSVIGEEFGFLGSVLFLILVCTITYLIIKTAIQSKDLFAKLLVFGISMVYALQSFINIGVSLSLIPNTGINLPMVSNGGTSLVAFCFMFGVVLNVSRYNNENKQRDKSRKRI
ncbi:FtsW/RodA/SpoVE family cell cycle protein [uncultured Helcococcus sp.]|uniref:FtsW/RodA/SpoVE family cell cycle protein n=1 Tax=uncultured Helcococcus sp. TaxID=1072508 RepID=UPI002630C697|nr:FtsW/RodA/SpoVE family cell cycle protein [uncultured Helcococcus sp.]